METTHTMELEWSKWIATTSGEKVDILLFLKELSCAQQVKHPHLL